MSTLPFLGEFVERFTPVPVYAAIDGWKSEHVVKYFEIQDCSRGERLILSGIREWERHVKSGQESRRYSAPQWEDLGTRLKLNGKVFHLILI